MISAIAFVFYKFWLLHEHLRLIKETDRFNRQNNNNFRFGSIKTNDDESDNEDDLENKCINSQRKERNNRGINKKRGMGYGRLPNQNFDIELNEYDNDDDINNDFTYSFTSSQKGNNGDVFKLPHEVVNSNIQSNNIIISSNKLLSLKNVSETSTSRLKTDMLNKPPKPTLIRTRTLSHGCSPPHFIPPPPPPTNQEPT